MIPSKSAAYLLVALSTVVAADAAAIGGRVQGTLKSTERRDRPNWVPTNPEVGAAVTFWPNDRARNVPPGNPTKYPLDGILVRLKVTYYDYLSDETRYSSYYTRADDEGYYEIDWDTGLDTAWVSSTLRVSWARPDMPMGTVTQSKPTRKFYVAHILGGDSGYSTSLPLSTGTLVKNITFTSSWSDEYISAYFTANELYDRVVAQSSALSSDMNDIAILIESTITPSGVTPTDDAVFIWGFAAQNFPETLAHELGHMLAWRQLDIPYAPYGLQDYSICGNDGPYPWGFSTIECEKIAFWEGFADLILGAWLYPRDAQGSRSVANNYFLENASSSVCIFPLAQFKQSCVTNILWDFYDNPPGDDDNISNRSMISVGRTLREYPRSCPFWNDNRCNNESGTSGMNLWDFHGNFAWSNSNDITDLANVINSTGAGNADTQ